VAEKDGQRIYVPGHRQQGAKAPRIPGQEHPTASGRSSGGSLETTLRFFGNALGYESNPRPCYNLPRMFHPTPGTGGLILGPSIFAIIGAGSYRTKKFQSYDLDPKNQPNAFEPFLMKTEEEQRHGFRSFAVKW